MLAAGDLDPTFDVDGWVSASFEAGDDVRINGMAIQNDGKIVVAGTLNNNHFIVARFNEHGTLDTTFGDNDSVGGYTKFQINGQQSIANDVTIDHATGAIYVVGRGANAANTQIGFAVAKLGADGELDASFGSGGVTMTPFLATALTEARGVVLQSDGKIVVAGVESKSSGTRNDFAVARYNTNGTLDTTFDVDGKQTTDFNGQIDDAFDVAIQQVGVYEKIVVVGSARRVSGIDDFALVRYNPNGSLDTAVDAFDAIEFGVGGKATTALGGGANPNDGSTARAVAVDAAGRIVVAGTRLTNSSGTSSDLSIARYGANGQLDTTDFNPSGVGYGPFGGASIPGVVRIDYSVLDTGSAIAIQPDGKYVIGATVQTSSASLSASYRFGLARINPTDGSLDTTFSSDGLVQAPAFDDGVGPITSQPEIVRLTQVALQPSGKIVASGFVDFEPSPTDYDYVLARYESGLVTSNITGLADVDEGATYTLQLTSSDPGTTQWTINWGDGDTQIVPGNPSTVTHVYADGDNNYTITATLTNGTGTVPVGTHDVFVHNVDPTLTVDQASVVANEGATASNSGTFGDVPADTVTVVASIGTVTQSAGVWSWSYDTLDDLQQTVTITATDGDGGSAVVTFDLEVNNVAPTLTVDAASVVADEGQTATNSGTYSDVLADTVSLTASVGTIVFSGGVWNWSFTGTDDLTTTSVTITASDEDGGSTIATFDFAINNVDPALTTDNATVTINEGQIAVNSGTYTDVPADTVTLVASLGTVLFSGGLWTWSYNGTDDLATTVVEITASDEDGGSTIATFDLTVNNVAPVADDATLSLTENAPNGTVVGNVTANDPGSDTLSFSLVGGTGAGAFAVSSAGVISVSDSALLDFETTPTLTLEVEVSDGDGGTDTAFVTVNLINLASISGVVFVDVNQNGLYDANEPGIDGVVVKLLDEFGNPVLDDLGDEITAVTDGGGFYLFDDLDPGVYQLFEMQPSGVADGAEHLGSLGGTLVANDRMQVTLEHIDAFDYAFAELGQQVTTGDAATIGFWQNKHGQALITQGGSQLASWLSTNFSNVFGNALAGASGSDVAAFYREQLFKQASKKSAGPAKVDAQFMAVALATYFTSDTLAGQVAASYGFHVTDTGIGTKIVNVGNKGAAFNVANNSNRTILQLLLATDQLTDQPDTQLGFSAVYDIDGDGIISSAEAALRAMANDLFTSINESGGV